MPSAVLVFLISLSLFFFLKNEEKHELQPNDLAISKSLEASGRIYVYQKDLADTLVRTFSLALETYRHRCQTMNLVFVCFKMRVKKREINKKNFFKEKEKIKKRTKKKKVRKIYQTINFYSQHVT